jgi:hypothetical protein
MVATKTTEHAKHRAPDDLPSLVGDLATGYDILRAHYLAECERQKAAVADAAFTLDALLRRHHVDPVGAPAWRVVMAKRAVQDAQAVQAHVLRMLACYPERNRDSGAAS